uniref:Uncharacterized protein n=1 Tax=Nelumbo nucifera TaxID=4432 RepID=A0A822Z6X8_NELNU|nr:TPA_asm: hypothetical protein HUJ06_013472 [Nelumbo nucifera]
MDLYGFWDVSHHMEKFDHSNGILMMVILNVDANWSYSGNRYGHGICIIHLSRNGKCLLGPVFEAVGQRVNNVVKVKENIEQLRKQVRELEKTKESVEKLIKKAERKGEDIKDNVTKWLEDVMSIIDETNSFIDNEIKENGSCFKGLYL